MVYSLIFSWILSKTVLKSEKFGLCLLVYSIGQRQLRYSLVEAKATINNQLGKATQCPTLRWVLQCFHDVHFSKFLVLSR